MSLFEKLGHIQGALLEFLRNDRASCLLFFVLGVTLRGIPELLVPQYPVGYETIAWYAPPMMAFAGRSLVDVFVEFFRSSPLFYVLMWFAVNISGAHAFLILKVAGPLFYGVLVVSFFVFLRRGLKFDWKMAFVATFLLAFQIAALRESWDRFRTVIGLTFLFAALTVLRSDYRHKWPLVAVLSVLTVLSRDYVALVLFVTVLGYAVLERKDRVMSLVALVPALTLFMVMVNPSLFMLAQSYVPEGIVTGRGHLWVVQDAFVIFAVCYLALLPFVVRGLHKDSVVGSMTGWLFFGSFSILSPWFSVPGYQRWLMLLVFPFTLYAVKGFERFQLFNKRRVKVLIVIILGFVVIGAGYSTGAFSYVGLMTNSYVAVNFVQSSISWDRVDDVKAVLGWLDENAVSNSSVLAEECFYGWTLIYLARADEDVKVIPYGAASPPMSALEMALREGFSRIYLVWYTEQGWSGWEVVHSENEVSVFQYVSNVV